MMKKLALFLCMVPAFARAEGVTVNLYPAWNATYQSSICLPDTTDFSASMILVINGLMTQAQQGFKSLTIHGCNGPIADDEHYAAIYDDVSEGGYVMVLPLHLFL
jgi:hypothetical protein